MAKDFNKFMSHLQETNQTLDFFCDFDKISQNVEDIKLSLCMLNSLIGSNDMRKSVETIWNRDKTAFNVMDILIAVRSDGTKNVLNSLGQCVVLDSLFDSVDGVLEFLSIYFNSETGIEYELGDYCIVDKEGVIIGTSSSRAERGMKNAAEQKSRSNESYSQND